jgi:hypothetical protein
MENKEDFEELSPDPYWEFCCFDKNGIPHKKLGGSCKWCYINNNERYIICKLGTAIRKQKFV